MSLIIYYNGELAADTGCTRNGSIETFHKLYTHGGAYSPSVVIGYAGELDAIERHWLAMQRNGFDGTAAMPPLNCAGIAVVCDRDAHTVYTFNCHGGTTGEGIWIPARGDAPVVEGDDGAVLAALGVLAGLEEASRRTTYQFTARDAVVLVADVHNGCALPRPVDYVAFGTERKDYSHD